MSDLPASSPLEGAPGAGSGQSIPIDSIPQPTFIYDAETLRYLAVNQAALDLYGWSREEFLAMKVTDIRPPEDVARLVAVFKELTLAPRRLGVWRHHTKSGALLLMDIYSQDWVEGGRRARLIVASDVTERTRLEAALRESEDNFRTFFDSNPVACLVMRASDGVYTAVNQAFSKLSGFTREEAVGRRWTDLNLWLEPEKRDPLVARLLEDGLFEDVELRFRNRAGAEFIGLLSARLIELSGQVHAVTVLRDITERRRAMQERVDLLEQLRQAQKMEAVGRLAGGVAHDFNNMLTVVSSVTDLLLGQLGPGAPMAEDLGHIRQAASRAADLTKQLLAFSRKQVLQPVELDLGKLVGGLEKMLRVLVGERVRVELALQRGRSAVRADPTQLTQVLLNLAINARDAMPGGGALRIELRGCALQAGEAGRHGELRPGRYLLLSVSDTGVGMDAETQRRAFEPFFTTKGEAGTGLGLATVYGIVTQSGGHVELESAPARGTTFRVWLPALPEAPAGE